METLSEDELKKKIRKLKGARRKLQSEGKPFSDVDKAIKRLKKRLREES